MLAPLLTGFVVQATGGFVWAFALAAVAGLIGVLYFPLPRESSRRGFSESWPWNG